MTTTKLKNLLVKKINNIEDEEFLNAIKIIIESKESDLFFKMSDEEKRLVKKSSKDLEEGRFSTENEVFNRLNKWLEER